METAVVANFKEKFQTPPPLWFKDIKQEAYKRITEAPFAQACRQGDKEVMKKLIVSLWPFVDIFPRLVRRGYIRLMSPAMYFRYGILTMLSLNYRSIVFLGSIEQDEKSHRALWLDSGLALELQYPASYKPTTPQTQAWIDEVAKKTNPSEMFLAFVAIEFIAESVSKNFIVSEHFKKAFGNSKSGLGWFTVHTIDHEDVSHENLELHLACAFHSQSGTDMQNMAEHTIMGVIHKFLIAANACG
ncbi:MAG: hypothetical protein G01um101429_3 [Parcubacteria group bacterium Gr01-1014_29]|nr:MAG: hypothetical protein G01um101429_3 [Parcubacteria group bacterium Gr01-1014_29]